MTAPDDLLGDAPDHDPMEFALTASAVEAALFGTKASVNMGRFVLLGELGRGGMGIVYSAWDPRLDRRVALKVVRPELSGGTRNERILREAKAVARLSDPNIVTVHEVGESDGRMFIAMEYVHGDALQDHAASVVGMRPCIELYLQAARGLMAAHAGGIVHRDFKPSNVLVSRDGDRVRARVSDFGVARISAEPEVPATIEGTASTELTVDGVLLGTPAYMAPEQLSGGKIGPQADQFSFCVALFEALQGVRPFEGSTITARYNAIMERRVVRARSESPRAVLAAVRRGLEPAPEDRHADMDALIAALESGLHRRKRMLMAGAISTAVVVAAVGGAMTGGRDEPRRCNGAEDAWAATAQRGHATIEQVGTASTLDQSAQRALDGYGQRWVEARTTVCEATHQTGTQSSQLLDLRVACLDQMQLETEALIDVVASGGSNTTLRARDAIARLDPPEHCVDATERTAIVPPKDPSRHDAFDALLQDLANARTDFRFARWKDGHEHSLKLVEDAQTYGDDQLLALSTSILATFEARVGDPKHAVSLATDALATAVRSDNDRAASSIATGLVYLTGYMLSDTKTAEAFGRLALAWSDDDPEQEAAALENLGINAFVARDYELAEQRHRQAQQLLQPGPAAVRSAINLSAALARHPDLDKQREAGPILRNTLTLAEDTYGPDHPSVAAILQNLASRAPVWVTCEEVLPMLERTVEIKRRTLGKDAVQLSTTLTTQGRCLRRVGRARDGLAAVDRAIEIVERKVGSDSAKLLGPHERRIEALIELGRLDDAQRQLDATIVLAEKLYGSEDPEGYGLFLHRAAILQARGQSEAALDPFLKGIAMARKINETGPWLRAHELNLCKLYFELGQSDEGRALATIIRDQTPHPGPLASRLRDEAAALLESHPQPG